MKAPQKFLQAHGLVAILDALGARNFETSEIEQFLNAREHVLGILKEKSEDLTAEGGSGQIPDKLVTTFTFNDTVVVTFRSPTEQPDPKQLQRFLITIRNFLVHSLDQGVLFRGAIGAGRFYINERTNTVMGDAVSDAAICYEEAQWLGIHCTPRCSMLINAGRERSSSKRSHVVIDYEVPLREGKRRAKALNWPRVFQLPNTRPWEEDGNPRAKLLELLARKKIPVKDENKYLNSIAFFDHCMATLAADGVT